MKIIPRLFLLILVAVCLVLCAFMQALAGGDEWRPIDPADLASKTPVVEKDADAEALFWEVSVADEVEGGTVRTVFRHYLRIKIFTERGRESQSKIDIPYLSNWKISEIAARTITPDNHIIELKKEDVFERTIVRGSGLKIKAKSFAMPGVEPGSIIEYRWREVRNDRLANYIRLQFQREVPHQATLNSRLSIRHARAAVSWHEHPLREREGRVLQHHDGEGTGFPRRAADAA
jgi:hypothetical protein